jgi:uncharacterized protein (DUF1684 family)
MRRLLKRPVTRVVLAVVLVVLVAGLAWFEPWRAFTSSHLDEPAPASAETIGEGTFVSQEHETTGTARVLELPDGSLTLRLEGFATSDGPDVHVWLSDASAGGDWGSYDDGRFVQLGEIKATDGNHNYAIPTTDLAGMRSVVIWCDRFNVAFGSASI